MADVTMIRRQLLVLTAVAGTTAAVFWLLQGPLAPIEDQVSRLKYAVRGPRAADTNVVIIYIDDEAVVSLGWPVRRNFYALMVKALADLHVSAIGVEVMFEDQKLDYPEYDELLGAMIGGSKKVVLPAYFGSIHSTDPGGALPQAEIFSYPHVTRAGFRGAQPHLPLPGLRERSFGIGHLNFTEEGGIPVFVSSSQGIIPAFGLEVLRASLRGERAGVTYEGDEVVLAGVGRSVRFPVSGDGTVALNFPGTISAFRAFPFLEVLKSYDALRAERPATIPMASFRDKVVLIAVIAEGRSQFFRSPVDNRFPTVGLHAVFIDNALGSGFVRPVGVLLTLIMAVLVGVGVGAAALFTRSPLNRVFPLVIVSATILLSFGLFASGGILLSLTPQLLVSGVTGIAALLLRQRRAKDQFTALEAEKDAVLADLRDREAKLAVLERELVSAQSSRPADRMVELLEEIGKYKAEIRALSSRADDMEVYREEGADFQGNAVERDGILYDRTGKMSPVIDFIGKIAGSESPVLILGESGTGKELVARAIHKRSTRSQGPFVAVNCGALTEGLLESELFGHEKGAFTGAVKERIGRFELANGGTIFLDEIGEVSEGFQVKLLRVLQEGELERVGGNRTIKVSVRVLAATNRDLKEAVRTQKFREDLYYRLNVLTIALPPLRERQGDIPLLVRYFLQREGGEFTLSRNVMSALQGFPWRGNIRELESAIKRAALLARSERRTMITVKDLSDEVAAAARAAVAVEDQVLEALREKKFSRSSVSATAEEMGGMNRGTVAEYLRGECLKAFVEQTFDMERAARHIALGYDPAVIERVRKKLTEYLQNIAEVIDKTQPWDRSRQALKPKSKNLPQKYHTYLEAVAKAYYRGIWRL